LVDSAEYKQPHEGIEGFDLRCLGDLLCIGDEAQLHRFALVVLARNLQLGTMLSNPGTAGHRMYQRMKNPQVGDLVVEESTLGMSLRKTDREGEAWCRGFGILLGSRMEWATTDEEWAAELEEEDPIHTEDYYNGDSTVSERTAQMGWYVQYGPSPELNVSRWWNCEFLAIPIDPWEFRASLLDSDDPPAAPARVTIHDLLFEVPDE
jgi:hypothetical protein